MQLEDYFEFLDPDDIPIKGHFPRLIQTPLKPAPLAP